MQRGILLLAITVLALGASPPQHARNGESTEQQTNADQSTPAQQLNTTGSRDQSGGCPGTSEPQMSCAAVSAIAAEEQVNVYWVQATIGIVTVIAAVFAALFAWSAATAGHNGNRPWIVFDEFRSDPFGTYLDPDGVQLNNVLPLRMWVRNTGQMPAIKVETAWEIRIAGVNDIPTFKPEKDKATGTLGSLRDMGSKQAFLSAADSERIRADRDERLYVYGRITYRDPAYPKKVRVTELCYAVHFVGPHGAPIGVAWRYSGEPTGPQQQNT